MSPLDVFFSKIRRGVSNKKPVNRSSQEPLYIGRTGFPLNRQTLSDMAIAIAYVQKLTIKDGDTSYTLNHGVPCHAFAEGQAVATESDGRAWAQVKGGTMFELPTSCKRDDISHVFAYTAQRYSGRSRRIDYRDTLCKVFLVPDQYVDSIKNASAKDAGQVDGGSTWYREPWRDCYDENGQRVNRTVGYSAYDGEAAILYSLLADGVGKIPSDYDAVMGDMPVLGGDATLDGDFSTHSSRCIERADLDAAIDKYLGLSVERVKVDETTLDNEVVEEKVEETEY